MNSFQDNPEPTCTGAPDCGVKYTVVRQRHVEWNLNKWTQTSKKFPVNEETIDETEYWKHGTLSHSLLQADIHRVIGLYDLTGSKDLKISQALSDILSCHEHLSRDEISIKMLKLRIRRAITSKKYYEKMRTLAHESGRSIVDVLNRGRHHRNEQTPTTDSRDSDITLTNFWNFCQ